MKRRRIWPDDPPSLAEVYPSADSQLREIRDSVEKPRLPLSHMSVAAATREDGERS